jgi:catechol 2,3-dioxygenase-like lactoylglutathione lyase family enzyme
VRVEGLTPILNVSDIEASIAWFEKVGWRALWTWNGGLNAPGPAGFAGVCSGERAEIFLCRNCQGSKGERRPQHPDDDEIDGVWMSWWVESPAAVDEAHAIAVEHGLDVTRPPTDEPWGVREFHLRHPDGHTFRIGSGLPES